MATILYRSDGTWNEEESLAASRHFSCISNRMFLPAGSLIIPRYSSLPYYQELEEEMKAIGSKLINSYAQHRYVANMLNWYSDLEHLTPKTWFNLGELPSNTRFVVKGETNSKKFLWKTHMYAENNTEAMHVWNKLMDDTLLSQQQICFREFIDFEQLTVGINGMPIINEHRFFVANSQILSGGFYWSSHVNDIAKVPSPDEVPRELLAEIINIIGDKCNFYALDVAKTSHGEWMLVELNCGTMSGLSENDPIVLYRNLKEVLSK